MLKCLLHVITSTVLSIIIVLISSIHGLYSLHKLTNNEKQTPLHLACQEGHTRIVEKLLKKCPKVERNDLLKVYNIEKKTALHLAVESLRINHSSETKVAHN